MRLLHSVWPHSASQTALTEVPFAIFPKAHASVKEGPIFYFLPSLLPYMSIHQDKFWPFSKAFENSKHISPVF